MSRFRYTSIAFVLLLIAFDIAYFGGVVEWWWAIVLLVIYLHLLVLGAIYIRWNFYLHSFNSGKNEKYIALTFDDGPADETNTILDILKELDVKAAFFSIGKNAEKFPALVKRWDEEGHLVGNHSYAHGFNFDWQSSDKMAMEIDRTNQAIQAVINKKPLLFRPPYGVTNPNLARAVKRTGMHSVGWSVRSFDTSAKNADQLLTRVLSKLKGGDIILLHDSMAVTRTILTDLIIKAREKGFTFVRVDKMLELDAYAP